MVTALALQLIQCVCVCVCVVQYCTHCDVLQVELRGVNTDGDSPGLAVDPVCVCSAVLYTL